MKATIALLLVLAFHSFPSLRVPVQSPNAAGRWRIEFTFADTGAHHALRFETEESGKATYLLLDRVSSLLDPAQPSKAEWAQTAGSDRVRIAGAIEFPIGNVGRNPGTLVFTGTLETADSIAGDFSFSSDAIGAPPSRAGTFKATRITEQSTPRVELLSPNSGGKVRRGTEVEIEWQAQSGFPILAQQIFLSLDRGESFIPITSPLDGETTQVSWVVPDTLPNVKKALLKVMVVNAAGDIAEDISKQTFKIR